MKWRRPLAVPLIGMQRTGPIPPIPSELGVTASALIRLSYIEARSPYQREVLGAYSRAVIELARCHHELEQMNEPDAAATLARYVEELTGIACEHVAMSAEIHQEPQ